MIIKPTKRYVRSYKKYRKKHYPTEKIDTCIHAIINQESIFLKQHKDHKLVGKYREMHIDRQYNDDWLLIYAFDEYTKEVILVLVDMGTHKEYKIDPKIIENIEGNITVLINQNEHYDFGNFRADLNTDHMMIGEKGYITNPDGFYYFNDPDALIFSKVTPESKKELRKAIEANMIPADQKVD